MTMQEGGGGTPLGGISYSIGVNLARFEASLIEAEQIARQRAGRIGSAFESANLSFPRVAEPRSAYVTQRVHVEHQVVTSEVVYPAVKSPPPVSFRQQIRIEQSQTGFAAEAQQAFATASRRAASALRAEQQAAAQVGEQLATLTASKQQATEAERSFARATRASNRAQTGERYAGGEREEATTQAARVVLPASALSQVRSGARRFFTEQSGAVTPGRDPLSLAVQAIARAGRSVAGGVGRFLSSESGELNLGAFGGGQQETELTAQQRRARAQPRGPGGRFVAGAPPALPAGGAAGGPTGGNQPGTPQFAAAEVQRLMRTGLSRFEAMSQVEMETGVPRLHIAPHLEALQQQTQGPAVPRNASRLANAFSGLQKAGLAQQDAITYLSTHFSMAKAQVTALLQQANVLDESVVTTAQRATQTPAERARERARTRVRVRAQTLAAREAAQAETAQTRADQAAPPGRQRGGIGNLGGLLPTNAAGLLRVAGAFVGIGFGINVAAGAARNLHQAVADALDAETAFERAARATNAVFGERGSTRLQTAARSFAANTDVRGTSAQFLQAQTALGALGPQFNIGQADRDRVVTAAGQLARIHGTELVPTAEAFARAIGGDGQALSQYGIYLTDTEGRIRGLGLTYEQLAQSTGRANAAQTILRLALADAAQQQSATAGSAHTLSDDIDVLSRRWDLLKARAGAGLVPVASTAVNLGNTILSGRAPRQSSPEADLARVASNLFPGGPALTNAIIGTNESAGMVGSFVNAVRQAFDRLRRAPIQAAISNPVEVQGIKEVRSETEAQSRASRVASAAIQQQSDAYAQLAARAQVAANAIREIEQQRGPIEQVGQAALGPDFPLNVTEGGIRASAAAQAESDVLRQREAAIAQSRVSALRARLEQAIQQAGSSGSPRGADEFRQELAELNRRETARIAQVRAQSVSSVAGLSSQQSQANLSAFMLRQQERQLSVATDLAGVRIQDLDLQGRMAPLQLEQANLQDRIRVAQRENLQLTLQRIAAEQSALPAANQLADLQFQQTEAVQEIAAFYVNRVRGVTTPGVDAARVQQDIANIRENALATPQAELDVTRAQRPVQLAERAQRADELTRQGRMTSLEQEQRTLEDQLIPLDAARRLEQARTAEIERRLAIEAAQEEPGRVDLQRAVDRANRVQIEADAAVRRAEAQAAGLNPDDLTGEATRRLAALPAGAVPPDLPAAVNPALSSINAGQSLQIGTIAIDARGSSLSEAQIRAATEQGIGTAFTRFVQGFDTNPGSAPVGVAGATP